MRPPLSPEAAAARRPLPVEVMAAPVWEDEHPVTGRGRAMIAPRATVARNGCGGRNSATTQSHVSPAHDVQYDRE
jgi:hypothetical protein